MEESPFWGFSGGFCAPCLPWWPCGSSPPSFRSAVLSCHSLPSYPSAGLVGLPKCCFYKLTLCLCRTGEHALWAGAGWGARAAAGKQFPAIPAPATLSLQVAFRLDFEFSKSIFLHHLEIQLAAGRSGLAHSFPLPTCNSQALFCH